MQEIIARGLRHKGLNATAGGVGSVPAGATCVVGYEDRWIYRNFVVTLSKIKIWIKDGHSGEIVAQSEVRQGFLGRKKGYAQLVRQAAEALVD